MTPGPIGINSATYVGYTAVFNSGASELLAVFGSLVASLAVMLPSVVLMLVVSRFFMKYSTHRNVEAVFAALRPVVVGLIASAALLLMKEENFGSPKDTPLQFCVSVALFVSAFVAMKFFKASPILILLLAGAFGGLFYSIV
jgi:chromate transporter